MRILLILTSALFLTACPSSRRSVVVPDGAHRDRLRAESLTFQVAVAEGVIADIQADLVIPDGGGRHPAVIFVPGAGRVSRAGTRVGDGTRRYRAPVDVTASWAAHFAGVGFLALSYDKRTCSARDDARCRLQPSADLDERGPVALTKDLDAACAVLAGRSDFDGRLVLFGHGQSTQTVLASTCAMQASLLVLTAPIPRRVDRVMVDSLRYREKLLRNEAKAKTGAERRKMEDEAANLKNLGASLDAAFRSMAAGKFAEDARFQGATLAFWRGWIDSTGGTDLLLARTLAPRLVVLGKWDLQYAPADKKRIQEMGDKVLLLDAADHHLLQRDTLSKEVRDAVSDAVVSAISANPS